jgi:hypothetical protein
MFTAVYSGGAKPLAVSGNASMMWRGTPCGSGCSNVMDDQGVTWPAHLANGTWTATIKTPMAVDCKNGVFAPGTSVMNLNAVDSRTLRGTIVGTSDGPACGSPTPITAGATMVTLDQA